MSLHSLTIHELSAKLKHREVSSVELTESVFARIASVEERLRSYITLCRESALAEAKRADERLKSGDDSPLLGIPIALKDIFLTEGVPTTCASKILGNFVPPYDGTAVTKLKSSGAVFVGKTNMANSPWARPRRIPRSRSRAIPGTSSACRAARPELGRGRGRR